MVDTVDPSPNQRIWPPKPDWNEWDFLDYRSAGLAHQSWNCTLDQLPDKPIFDGANSVSVIEHLPADDRRAMLADISARVRPGRLVLLTIDLVRGRDGLWNRNRGLVVEDSSVHGTFQNIVDEGEGVGLELFHQETVQDWGDAGVDIGLLVFRRTAPQTTYWWMRARRRIATGIQRSPT